MSSSTPNINLTLPIGSEKVSRQIINDNNTKIDTAIGTLNSNIARQVITATFNSTGTTYFNSPITHGSIQNGIYSVSIAVSTKTEIPANQELNIGTVDKSPSWTITGYIIVNNTSLLVGGVQIASNGVIYIRLNDSIPASRDVIIHATGTKY